MRIPLMAGLFLAFILGYPVVFHSGNAFAQLPTPNSFMVPPPPLRPIVPLQGVPSLAIVPTPAANQTPISAARIFNCSCFGPSSPTSFMGRVTAPSYFGAQQAAVSACLAYNENKQPQLPEVTTGQGQTAIPGQPAGVGGVSQLGAASGLVANQAAVAS